MNTLKNAFFKKRVIFTGLLAAGFGYIGLLTLTVALGVICLKPDLLQDFRLEVDALFYILCAWAILEFIHHHVYKLTYGRYDTLEYIIRSGRWQNVKAPLGGAIGVQFRKISLRH